MPFERHYIRPTSQGHLDRVRNTVVQKALDLGCTHLWLCDSDQKYPQNTLIKLIEHNLDVVGAKVHRRWPPYEPVMYRYDICYPHYNDVPDEEWINSRGLIEVDSVGTGCLLVKADVFKNVKYPWFKFDEIDGRPIGEDVYFAHKVRELGYKIFVDTSINVGHVTTMIINTEFYMAYKQVAAKQNGNKIIHRTND